MDVKRCDRCGEVFVPENTQEGRYSVTWKEEHNKPVEYDLCSKCESDLHEFLMARKRKNC